MTDKMYTLNTAEVHGVAYGINCSGGADAQVDTEKIGCITAAANSSGNNKAAVAYALDCRNAVANKELSATLQAHPGGGFSYNCVNPVAYTMQAIGKYKYCDVASSCKQRDYKDATDLVVEKKCYAFYPQMKAESQCFKPNITSALVNGTNPGFQNAICYGICSYASNSMMSDNPNSGIYEADTARTLDLNGGNPACNQGGVAVCEKIIRWIVRRLTPLECTRLQGYPDGWVEIGEWVDSKGKKHKDADSPKYKALGNSIALPFWYWMFCRMAKHLPEEATLGSLFDGIGGFPICWEAIHGRGTARWASEIEEFPIAVTKMRFGED